MPKKKKPSPRGGVSQAALDKAAAMKATSKVELSADNEARVRELLASIKEQEAPAPAAGGSNGGEKRSQKQVLKNLQKVYDGLEVHGFSKSQIERALQELDAETVTQEAALDWLCFHIPAAELPKHFAGGLKGSMGPGEIQVLAKAPARPAAPAAPDSSSDEDPEEVARARARREGEKRVADEQRRAEQEREKAKQAEWIRTYMEQGSSDESEDDDWAAEAAPPPSASDSWEVWNDPRARARRRTVDPEQRRRELPGEFFAAKDAASAAKALKDKKKQQEAGMLIRELKEEMARLGMSEADLEPPPPPPAAEASDEEFDLFGNDGGSGIHHRARPAPAPAPAGDPEAEAEAEAEAAVEMAAAEEEGGWDEEGGGGGGESSVEGDQGASGGAGGVDAGASSSGGAGAGEEEKKEEEKKEEEEEDFMNVFDEEFVDTTKDWQPSAPAKKKLTVDEELALLDQLSLGKPKKPAKGAVKGKEAPKIELQQPKSMLQQFCQKQQWPAPRFQKHALSQDGAFRYSVTVERTTATKGGAAVAGGRRAKRNQKGPVVAEVPPEDDGAWPSIQDAQNAAATRGLYMVAGDQPLYRLMTPAYRDLWEAWEARDAQSGVADAAGGEEERRDFIQGLLAKRGGGGGGGGAGGAGGGAVLEEGQGEAEAEAEAESWEEAELGGDATKGGAEAARRQEEEAREYAASETLLHSFQSRRLNPTIQKVRAQLPIVKIKEGLAAALAASDVAVVSGETGCGKTTQVPQFLLEQEILAGRGAVTSIICTQPRRIAAVSVAERVAEEMAEPAPGGRGGLVGYHVRLDAAATRATRLLFCTTGILLRRMAGDNILEGVSHVVVDEVHERTMQGDFLITLLRDLVARRRRAGMRPLKVVLMSATLDAALFAQYFGGCEVLSSHGRTFPVEQKFLEDAYEVTGYRLEADSPAALRAARGGAFNKAESTKGANMSRGRAGLIKSGWGDDEASTGYNEHFDAEQYEGYSESTLRNLGRVDEDRIDYELLEDLLVHIAEEREEGGILVFLPGMGEISSLHDRLAGSHRFGSSRNPAWILPLHSSLNPADQKKVFQRPPAGTRKIILATNIAETSITVDDIVFVVDTGKLKEQRYDPHKGMASLVEGWVSQANARQRKGRAGRVQPGVCFALYTRQRFENVMRAYQVPEIQRVPLVELCLQIKVLGLGAVGEFLEQALEPPSAGAVSSAIKTLREVGAMDEEEELTPLGRHLAALPVDVRVGKLLLLGAALGCLAPALTIAACLSYKSPFSAPFDQRDAAERAQRAIVGAGSGCIASGHQSDHLAMVAAYDMWQKAFSQGGARAAREACAKHFLGFQTLQMLQDMRQQFARLLADVRFVQPPGGGRGDGRCGWADDPKAPWNRYAGSASVIKAVLCAALYPNVASLDEAGGSAAGRPRWRDSKMEVAIHPASVNKEAARFQYPFLVFHEKVKTTRVYIRECTAVSPYALLLFGGSLQVLHREGIVLVDGWVRLKAPAQLAVLVKELRGALDRLLIEKIEKPGADMSATSMSVIDTIAKLLSDEDAEGLGQQQQ